MGSVSLLVQTNNRQPLSIPIPRSQRNSIISNDQKYHVIIHFIIETVDTRSKNIVERIFWKHFVKNLLILGLVHLNMDVCYLFEILSNVMGRCFSRMFITLRNLKICLEEVYWKMCSTLSIASSNKNSIYSNKSSPDYQE